MRIGIDGRALKGVRSGVGRYAFELLKHLDVVLPDAEFFIYYRGYPELKGLVPDRWHHRNDTSWLAMTMRSSILWSKFVCGWFCRPDKLDIFFAPSSVLPLFLPKYTATVVVVYDMNVHVVPKTMSLSNMLLYRFFNDGDLGRADRVVSISNGTAKRLLEYLNVPTHVVVHPGVSQHFRRYPQPQIDSCLDRYGLKRPFLLSVGTLEPRKNLEQLVSAFLELHQENKIPGVRLALTGGRGWKTSQLVERINRYPDLIHRLGYVPDEDLPLLYGGTEALVFPSIYEGFGIPVIEAQACGARVLTTDVPEIREAGGQGALYVSPEKDAIKQGILDILYHSVPTRSDPLPSWQQGAERLADLFRELVGSRL